MAFHCISDLKKYKPQALQRTVYLGVSSWACWCTGRQSWWWRPRAFPRGRSAAPWPTSGWTWQGGLWSDFFLVLQPGHEEVLVRGNDVVGEPLLLQVRDKRARATVAQQVTQVPELYRVEWPRFKKKSFLGPRLLLYLGPRLLLTRQDMPDSTRHSLLGGRLGWGDTPEAKFGFDFIMILYLANGNHKQF